MMMKLLLIGLLSVLSFSSLAAEKKLIFVSSEFAGISERNEAGDLTGLGVDIIRKIAQDLEIEIDIQLYPFNRMMSLMKEQKVDAAFGIYKKPDRETYMDYIPVSFFNDTYLFYTTRANQLNWDGEMASFPKDKAFCWVRGWSYFNKLYQIKSEILFHEHPSLEGCVTLLMANRFDLIAGPIRDIVPLIEKHGIEDKVKLLAKDYGLEGNYIAFPKGHMPELQQGVEQSLVRILKSDWYRIKLHQYGLKAGQVHL